MRPGRIKACGILNTVADEALGETGRNDATLQEDVKLYVATNASRSVAELTKGTPFPGTFIVDQEGRVTARFFEAYYRERSTASSILLRLGNGAPPVAATRCAAAHVDVTSGSLEYHACDDKVCFNPTAIPNLLDGRAHARHHRAPESSAIKRTLP